jgi:hypothetical protein
MERIRTEHHHHHALMPRDLLTWFGADTLVQLFCLSSSGLIGDS